MPNIDMKKIANQKLIDADYYRHRRSGRGRNRHVIVDGQSRASANHFDNRRRARA